MERVMVLIHFKRMRHTESLRAPTAEGAAPASVNRPIPLTQANRRPAAAAAASQRSRRRRREECVVLSSLCLHLHGLHERSQPRQLDRRSVVRGAALLRSRVRHRLRAHRNPRDLASDSGEGGGEMKTGRRQQKRVRGLGGGCARDRPGAP